MDTQSNIESRLSANALFVETRFVIVFSSPFLKIFNDIYAITLCVLTSTQKSDSLRIPLQAIAFWVSRKEPVTRVQTGLSVCLSVKALYMTCLLLVK